MNEQDRGSHVDIGLQRRILRQVVRGTVPAALFLAAACSSEAERNTPGNSVYDSSLEPTAVPTASINLPECSASDNCKGGENVSPDAAIASFAKQIMKPMFVPSEEDIAQGELLRRPDLSSYSRLSTVGGTDFIFSSSEVNGKSNGESILKDLPQMSDGSLAGVVNVLKEYFNVPESDKWATRAGIEAGTGIDFTIYELILTKTPEYQISLMGLVVPDDINSSPENPLKFIRVAACSVPAGTREYNTGTCLKLR